MIVICLTQLWKELGKRGPRRGVRASVESVIILRSQVGPAVKGKHRGRRDCGKLFPLRRGCPWVRTEHLWWQEALLVNWIISWE